MSVEGRDKHETDETRTVERGGMETQTRGGPTWVHFNGGGVTTGKVQVCRDKRVARRRESPVESPVLTGNARASGRSVLCLRTLVSIIQEDSESCSLQKEQQS